MASQEPRVSTSGVFLRYLGNALRGSKLKMIAYALTALVGAAMIAHTLGERYETKQVRQRGPPRRVPRQAPYTLQQFKDPFPSRPRIQTHNGHLVIEASQDKNIDFKTSGSRGSITINGHKIDQLIDLTQALEGSAARTKGKVANDSSPSMNQYEKVVANLYTSEDRFRALESGMVELRTLTNEFRKLTMKMVKRMRKIGKISKVQEDILSTLKRNDCFNSDTGLPVCKHGATCIDTYDSFKCLCPPNYEGPTCEQDVDECVKFRGTDLGCQNGARCVNLPGSYQCECTAQYHGVHCTEQHDDCSLSSSRSLCGYGKCINLARNVPNQARFECVCEQGWTTNGISPACVVDINECLAGLPANSSLPSDGSLPWANSLMAAYPCSQNPYVDCINLPGSFQCGTCPSGYSGNGRVCRDVDECATNNGGCSQSPLVECINTPGSRRCGSCPPGYTGDGVTCAPISACSSAPNGGCHPMARCQEMPEMIPDGRLCICRYPLTGSGVGVGGCRSPSGDDAPATTVVEAPQSDCRPDPCANGAQCEPTDSSFECICPLGWTGRTCDEPVTACGGRYYVSRGSLRFPLGGSLKEPFSEIVKLNSATTDEHEQKSQQGERHYNCLWSISVAANMSIRLLFSDLINKVTQNKRVQLYLANETVGSHLLALPTCNEYLEVSERLDGSLDQGRPLARFCADGRKSSSGGVEVKKAVAIIAKTNSVSIRYSFSATRTQFGDPSLSFRLNWTKTEPPCGGDLVPLESGSIMSPRFPEFYPAGIECRYLIRVPAGKRIRLQFAELSLLTSSPSSSNECADSLTILDGSLGADRPVLFRYCANNATLMNTNTLPAPIVSSSSVVELLLDSRANSGTPLMRPHQQRGFLLTYSAEATAPGCGGLYTLKSGAIVSGDYQAGTQEDPRVAIQLVRYFEQRSSTSTPRAEEFSWGRRVGPPATRCEYEIRPANQTRNHKVSLDWLEMPDTLADEDYSLSKWSRQFRCKRRRLTVLEGNPLDSSNRTELATFCAGDHYNASLAQFPPIRSSGHLMVLVYESLHHWTPEAPLADGPNGFKLRYSTVCTAVYRKLSGNILVSVNPEVSECIYHILLPPNNTIALQMAPTLDSSSDLSLTRPDGTCTAHAVFLDGAVQQTSSLALAGVSRQLSSYNSKTKLESDFESDIGSDSISDGSISSGSWKQAQRVDHGDDPIERAVPAKTSPPSSFFWQYSGSQVHDIKEFEVCTISKLSFNSLWNHLSIMVRMNEPEAVGPMADLSAGEESSRKQVRFMIQYKTIRTCGGIVSDPQEGQLPMAANNPSKSGDVRNSSCTWIIRAPVGQQIVLVFGIPAAEAVKRFSDWVVWSRKQQVGAQADFNCSQLFMESIELYEPSPNITRLLCPNELETSNGTTSWTTLSNTVYVRTVIDTTTTNLTWPGRKPLGGQPFKVGYKFVASRERQCGGRLIMDSGVITSPRFPFNYPPHSNCLWLIQAKGRQQIRLNFTSFDLERQASCQFDFLEIRNGPTSSSPLIGRFCNQDLQSRILISHSNQLWLHFRSDASLGRAGFEVHYDGAQTGCGGKLSSSSGQIDSPNYPSSYAHSADCEWIIELSNSNRVELTVEDLDLSSDTGGCSVNGTSTDYLEIFDSVAETTNGKSLGRFCHLSELKERQFNSSDNKLLIVYRSRALDNSRGFRLTYRARCEPVELFGYRGVIESPGYPSDYLPRTKCGWFIRSALGSNLTLAIADLDIESLNIGGTKTSRNRSKANFTCNEDSLQVWELYPKVENSSSLPQQQLQQNAIAQFRNATWNGAAGAGLKRLALNLCGQESELSDSERTIELDTNLVYVRFTSDHSVQGRGFRIEWQSRACGGQQMLDSIQPISFQEGPSTGKPSECVWLFDLTRVANTIEFHLNSDLRSPALATSGDPCEDASLTIYDGPTDESPVLSRNCDSQKMRETVMTSGGRALVRFYTSGRNNYARGFALSGWPSNRDGCMNSAHEIRTPFNRQSAVRRSPNYPDLYDSNQYRCYGLLTASNGRLRFHIEELDVPVDADGAANGLLEQTLCRSSGNYLLIRGLMNRQVERAFCGKLDLSRPGEVARSTVVMEQEASWAEFYTKGGFRGRWKFSYDRLCGSLVQIDYPRDFSSPNYPARPDWPQKPNPDDPNNAENVCIWRFKSDPYNVRNDGEKKLHLSIVNFIASERNDYDCLRIYEGVNISLRQSNFNLTDIDASLQPKIKLCKPSDMKHSTLYYVSQGSEITVLLTGSTVAKFRMKPFENYCGGEFQMNQAEFASLGYPQPYAQNLDCHYLIIASPGSRIDLNFLNFDLPVGDEDAETPGTSCDNVDYVEIRQLSIQKKLKHRLSQLTSSSSIKIHNFFASLLNDQGTLGGPDKSSENGTSPESNSPSFKRLQELGKLYYLFQDASRSSSSRPRWALPLDEFFENSQLIGRFCGKSAPNLSNLTLQDEVLVRFRSHGGYSDGSRKKAPRGFLAEYKIKLGGLIQLDETTEGYISSPGWPTKKRLNSSFTWKFETKLGQVIQFDLISLDLGSAHRDCVGGDNLNLYDGLNPSSDVKLAQLCGHLSFRSPQRLDNMFGSFSAAFLSSRIYPVYLAHNSQVRSNLIRSVRTTSNVASILYENLGSEGSFILRYRSVDKSVSSNQSSSDAPIELQEVMEQREAELDPGNIHEPSKICSQIFRLASNNASQVNLTTPNWPQQPPTNIDCHWLIYTQDNSQIRFSVEPTNLADIYVDYDEQGPRRKTDYCLDPKTNVSERSFISVYDGATHLAPLIGRHCLPVMPIQFQSTGRHLLVRYVHSGEAKESSKRFPAALKGRASLEPCGGQYHVLEPLRLRDRADRSKQYANNLNCRYYLFASNSDRVLEIFTDNDHFDLASEPTNKDCSVGDYIEIRDLPLRGDSMEAAHLSGRLLGRFCAGRKLELLEAPGSAVSIEFHTDQERVAKGWTLNVMSVRPRTTCPRGQVILTADRPFGRLNSPNWPHGFQGERHCRYILSAPINQTLQIDFIRLSRQLTYTDADSRKPVCKDSLNYLDDSEVFALRYDSRPLKELQSPVSGNLMQRLVKASPCTDQASGINYATLMQTRGDGSSLLQDTETAAFKTISFEDYSALSALGNMSTIYSRSHMLLMEYEASNLLPDEGFVALLRAVDRTLKCGGEISYPSAQLIESTGFGEAKTETDDFIYCDWAVDAPLESNPVVLVSNNLQPAAQIGDFQSTFMVFQILEIPPLVEGTSFYDSDWTHDQMGKTNEVCGLNRLLIYDIYLTTPTFACGNLTGLLRWAWIDPHVRRMSLRTRNVRSKTSDAVYRGIKAYFYEKSCPQSERVPGEGLRIRSHAGNQNTSYSPGICMWELRLNGGDYELWFEDVKFRPPQRTTNSSATSDCDPLREPDLDYLDIHASSERDSPLLARYCYNNQAKLGAQKANLLNMKSEISITFVAGLNRLSEGTEKFAKVSDDTQLYGWSMRVSRVRNDTTHEFCRPETAHSIYRFIRSRDNGYYKLNSLYTSTPSLASFLYPNNTHCEVTLDVEEGARLNLSFTGIFDFEQSRDCRNDYIQLDDLVRADPQPTSVFSTPAPKAKGKTATNVKTSATQVLNIEPKESHLRRIGRWCGRTRPTGYFLSNSSSVRVTFHSDNRVEGKGFQLDYGIISSNKSAEIS